MEKIKEANNHNSEKKCRTGEYSKEVVNASSYFTGWGLKRVK